MPLLASSGYLLSLKPCKKLRIIEAKELVAKQQISEETSYTSLKEIVVQKSFCLLYSIF